MKSILVTLLTLISLTAFPQGRQKVKVRIPATSPVLYEAFTIRDTLVYPLTSSGAAALAAAVTSGALNLTLANGAIIPAGTKPPRLPPQPPLVSWLQHVRYSYNSTNRLDIEVNGEPVELKIERQDGLTFTGANPDHGGVFNSNTYYGYGSLTGQLPFDKRWAFARSTGNTGGVPRVPLRLTFRRVSNPGQMVTYQFTPSVGVTRILITTPAPPVVTNQL